MAYNEKQVNEQKSARVTSSLGALLTGLSSKNAESSRDGSAAVKNREENEGFDMSMGEITDWSQLGKMDRGEREGGSRGASGGDGDEDFGYDDSRGGKNKNRNKKRESQGDREGSGKRVRQDSYKADVYGPKEVTDWNDLKMFEEDHDEQYFRDEEAVLAEQYGGNFIKLKYIAEGKIGYYCEICHAEMNAKKSLQLHCSGMKHLKKKDIWEKNGRKIIPGSGLGSNNTPAQQSQPPQQQEEKEWRSSRNNSRGGREGRGGGGGSWSSSRNNAPPAPSFRNDDYNQGSYRDRDLGGRKYYSRHEQDREAFDGRGDGFERESFFDRPRGEDDFFRDNYRDTGPRDGYVDRRDEPYFDRWGGRHEDNDRIDYGRFSPKREPYPGCRRPAPPAEEGKLAGGPTGTLLQKLGDCCVKSNDDAELAMNVISNLSVSLKDFYSIRGEAKVADLLGDVELKLKTIKALKVGLKVLGEASFRLKDEPSALGPGPVPAPASASSMFGSSAGFSVNQPVRYPVAGLYRPPVKY